MKIIFGLYDLESELRFSQDPEGDMDEQEFWNLGLTRHLGEIEIAPYSSSSIVRWVEQTTGVLSNAPRVLHPLHLKRLAQELSQSILCDEMLSLQPLLAEILRHTEEGLIAVTVSA